MAVVRTQYSVVSASATTANTVAFYLDIPRPADTAETNTIDFVKRPAARKDFEAGKASLTLSSAFAAATLLVYKIDILKLDPLNTLAPLDLSFSGFPDAPGVGQVQLQRTILDLSASPSTSPFAGNVAATTALLAGPIYLRASEFIRVYMYPTAVLTGNIRCTYDFGLNAANL